MARQEAAGRRLSPTAWSIVLLSVIGAGLEFVGIVEVAGRRHDLLELTAALRVRYRAHRRSAERQLHRLLWRPARPFPPWLEPSPRTISLQGMHSTARASHGLAMQRTMSGPLEERIQRLDDELQQTRQDLARFRDSLPAYITEATKDSWRGLLLLALGLAMLLIASMLGALNA